MIEKMPNWCYSNINPAFKDKESLTAVNMVAKLYSKMSDMIKDYNNLCIELTTKMEGHEYDCNQEIESFEEELTKLMHDYISMLDEKIKLQDKKIEELDLIVPDVPNIATTDYVLEEISKIEIPDTSNLATTEYVDNTVNEVLGNIETELGGV